MADSRTAIPLSFRVAQSELAATQRAIKDLRQQLRSMAQEQKAAGAGFVSVGNDLSKFSARSIAARNEVLKGTAALKQQTIVLDEYRRKLAQTQAVGGVTGGAGAGKLGNVASAASALGGGLNAAGLGGAGDVAQGIGAIAQAAQQAGPLVATLGATVGTTALAAGIAAPAVIAMSIAIDKFVKDLEANKERVTGAISVQRTYYELVATGTSESIQVGLAELKVKQLVAAQVRADIANAEQYARQQFGIFGDIVLSITGVADEAKKSDKELADLTGQISAFERALQSGEVAARDAANAEAELAKERAGLFGQFTQPQLDAWKGYQDGLIQLNEQYAERREGIEARLVQIAQDADASVAALEQEGKDRRLQAVAEFNKDEERVAKDHQADMLKMERDHNRTLGDAAARLDAVAFLQEQRDYADKKKEAEDGFGDARRQRERDLKDRLSLEKKGDDRRIADIRARQAKEDAAARAQLAALNNQLQADLRQRDAAFRAQFNQLAGSLNNQIGIQGQGLAVMEAQLWNWYNRQIAMFGSGSQGGGGGGSTGPGGGGIRAYALGGSVSNTGSAMLHAGEEVLRPDVARSARSLMGGEIDQGALLDALKGGGSKFPPVNATIVLGDIGQHAPAQIEALVEKGLTKALKKFNEGLI